MACDDFDILGLLVIFVEVLVDEFTFLVKGFIVLISALCRGHLLVPSLEKGLN